MSGGIASKLDINVIIIFNNHYFINAESDLSISYHTYTILMTKPFCLRSWPDKNTAQTDEEKQRERQRNEREQKNAELEAQQIKVSAGQFDVLRHY